MFEVKGASPTWRNLSPLKNRSFSKISSYSKEENVGEKGENELYGGNLRRQQVDHAKSKGGCAKVLSVRVTTWEEVANKRKGKKSPRVL